MICFRLCLLLLLVYRVCKYFVRQAERVRELSWEFSLLSCEVCWLATVIGSLITWFNKLLLPRRLRIESNHVLHSPSHPTPQPNSNHIQRHRLPLCSNANVAQKRRASKHDQPHGQIVRRPTVGTDPWHIDRQTDGQQTDVRPKRSLVAIFGWQFVFIGCHAKNVYKRFSLYVLLTRHPMPPL